MVGWIQRMFGIQMYHEEMQVKLVYGFNPIIIGKVFALDLENFLKMTDSAHFLSDGCKYIWYTDVS
jgi:hypothetical protein